MKPFRQWTYEDAARAITEALTRDVGSEEAWAANKALARDADYWREGKGYVGPRGGDAATARRVIDSVKSAFTPVDVCGEVLDNFVGALAGTEPAVSFPRRSEPNPESAAGESRTDARAQQMYDALVDWWQQKQLPDGYAAAARWSRVAARGMLRAWVATSALVRERVGEGDASEERTRLPQGLSFADALARVEVSAPEPDVCMVYVDPDTQARAAIFLSKRATGRNDASGKPEQEDIAELWFLARPLQAATDGGVAQENGEASVGTFCRIVVKGDDAGAKATEYGPLDFADAAYPIAQMTADLLLTEPVRKQTAQLAYGESIIGRTMETAGFRERTIGNAQPHGEWFPGHPPAGSPPMKTAKAADGEPWYLQPMPRVLGASIVTELLGVEITETSGRGVDTVVKRSLTDPLITYADPVDPDFAIKSVRHRRYTILRDCKQGHLAADGGEASGIAYQQARAVFAKDLDRARGPFERMLIGLLTAVIALADSMTATTDPLKGFLRDYRVDVAARVDPGPLTPEERAQLLAEWKDGVRSWESTASALGVENVEAERQALARDPMARLALVERVSEVAIAIATAPGGSMAAAARALRAAGLSEDVVRIARALEARDVDALPDGADDDLVDDADDDPADDDAADRMPARRAA